MAGFAEIDSFDGVTLSSLGLQARTPISVAGGLDVDVAITTGPGLTLPRYQSETLLPRPLTLVVYRTEGSSFADAAEFYETVMQLFRPGGGLRALRATHRGTAVEIMASVVRGGFSGSPTIVEISLIAPMPFWRAQTPATYTTSPQTPLGTVATQPVLTITPTTGTVRRRRVTISDNTGRGLRYYPIRIGPPDGGTIDTSGVSASAVTDYAIFHHGLPIPFIVQNPNHATLSTFDVFVDIPRASSTFVDIFYGSGVTNTLTSNALDSGGFDFSHATHGNGTWVWRTSQGTIGGKIQYSMFQLGSNPRISGAWTLGHFGSEYGGLFFGKTATSPLAFSHGTGGRRNDADGIAMIAGVEGHATTETLRGIGVILGGSGSTRKVQYLLADNSDWADATESVTDRFTTPGAVAHRIFLEPSSAAAAGTLTLQAKASDLPPRRIHDATKIPTISVGSAVDARVLDSVITNTTTGQAITIAQFYLDDLALVINAETGEIRPASGDVAYWGALSSIQFSDRDRRFELDPNAGANAWTITSGTLSMDVQGRWAL